MDEKLRLSTEAPVSARVIGVVAGVVFAVVGTTFAVLPLIADDYLRKLAGTGSCGGLEGIPPESLPAELQYCASVPDLGGLGPVRFAGLAGVPFALLGAYVVLRVLRTAVWLDGTTLLARRALGTRSVDLARADVHVEQVTSRTTDGGRLVIAQIPTLVARDPGSGRRVTVMLRLPGYELRRLADAMTLGRSALGRDADAHVIAGQLREIADNPLQLQLPVTARPARADSPATES
jgi:hypothetical protein